MKKMIGIIGMAVLLSGCTNTTAENGDELLVSTASSLTEVMKKMEEEFHQVEPDIELSFNYGSSSKLRSQIEQGAPADLFLSASEKDMEQLESEQLVKAETVVPFAENRLVLASLEEFPETADFTEIVMNAEETIAVGEPDSVPVGNFTKQALDSQGLWQPLEGRLIYAKDARQVVTYIESGNAGLGIVYSSDAVISQEIKGALEVPGQENPVVYPGAVVADSDNQQAAVAFLDFVTGPKGQAILEQYGFLPANEATP